MKKLLTSAAALMLATGAYAGSLDFESGFVNGQDIAGLDLGGITISAGGNAVEVTSSVPGGLSNFAINTDPFVADAPMRADFDTLISSFSVDMGDFGPSDDDTLFVEAYDSMGNLVDSTTFAYGTAGDTLETLSVSGSGIAYVLFDGGSQSFPFSIFADNLAWVDDVSAVPLPAGGALLLAGLGAFGVMRRRQR